MGDKFVGGRPERQMPCRRAILGTVDVVLRMFDSHAHSKGLLREGYVMFFEKLEYVASGMAAGENEVLCSDCLARGVLGRLDIDAGDGAGRIGANIDELCAITNGSAELFDALGNVGDDGGKDIGADVRLGVPQDIAGRARFDEGLENQAMGRVLGSCIELAVRERSRAAQTKLDIALGVEDALLKKEIDRLRASKRWVATLDKQRLKARFGEGKGGKEAGATGADNDGTLLGCVRGRGGE